MCENYLYWIGSIETLILLAGTITWNRIFLYTVRISKIVNWSYNDLLFITISQLKQYNCPHPIDWGHWIRLLHRCRCCILHAYICQPHDTNTTTLSFQLRKVLLTSNFGSSTWGESHSFYYAKPILMRGASCDV